jgi:hypothetical protein
MENAYEDYLVVKDRHALDKPSDRQIAMFSAKEEYGAAARECWIRNGEPSASSSLTIAEKVRDDEW